MSSSCQNFQSVSLIALPLLQRHGCKPLVHLSAGVAAGVAARWATQGNQAAYSEQLWRAVTAAAAAPAAPQQRGLQLGWRHAQRRLRRACRGRTARRARLALPHLLLRAAPLTLSGLTVCAAAHATCMHMSTVAAWPCTWCVAPQAPGTSPGGRTRGLIQTQSLADRSSRIASLACSTQGVRRAYRLCTSSMPPEGLWQPGAAHAHHTHHAIADTAPHTAHAAHWASDSAACSLHMLGARRTIQGPAALAGMLAGVAVASGRCAGSGVLIGALPGPPSAAPPSAALPAGLGAPGLKPAAWPAREAPGPAAGACETAAGLGASAAGVLWGAAAVGGGGVACARPLGRGCHGGVVSAEARLRRISRAAGLAVGCSAPRAAAVMPGSTIAPSAGRPPIAASLDASQHPLLTAASCAANGPDMWLRLTRSARLGKVTRAARAGALVQHCPAAVLLVCQVRTPVHCPLRFAGLLPPHAPRRAQLMACSARRCCALAAKPGTGTKLVVTGQRN